MGSCSSLVGLTQVAWCDVLCGDITPTTTNVLMHCWVATIAYHRARETTMKTWVILPEILRLVYSVRQQSLNCAVII